jgi:hypothetical protein
MGNGLLRLILAVIVGLIVGSIVMQTIHTLCQPMYPPPEGLDPSDMDSWEETKAWMKTLPNGAYVIAMLAHWAGTVVGVVVAMFITGRRALRPAVIVGILFTLAGIANIFMMPHPAWFPFVDLLGYLPLAWFVGKLLLKKDAGAATEAA